MVLPSSPNPHGGNGHALAFSLGLDPAEIVDLSASLNPFAPDVAAMATSALRSLRHYPDASAGTRLAAATLGVDPDCLVLTNGGAEAIALVAHHLRSGTTVDPEFSLYERHLQLVASGPESPGLGGGPQNRWRSNPNNPLGHLADDTDNALVWDEAFYPLATGRWSRGDSDAWRVGSLTKLWGCPGLRIGYVLAPTCDGARAIEALQPRWSVNGLALALLPQLFDATCLDVWARGIAELRRTFATDLGSNGFLVTESAANWVIIKDAAPLDALAAQFGVIVRNCHNFGLTNTYRVALPAPHQTDRVLTTFKKIADNR